MFLFQISNVCYPFIAKRRRNGDTLFKNRAANAARFKVYDHFVNAKRYRIK